MKIFFSLITMIIFLGCGVTSNGIVFKDKIETAAKLVTPKFEKMDPGIARILKNKVQIYSIKKVPQLTGEYDTVLNLYASRITILNHKNDTIKTIDYEGNDKDGYYLSEPVSRFVVMGKSYYSNGNIKTKNVGSWLGFTIGKAYAFTDKGIVDKVVDSEIGYTFDCDDVVKFCKRNKISLARGQEGAHNWIEKKLYNGKPAWFIMGYHDKKNDHTLIVILDGKNGRIMGTQKIPVLPE